jgi:DNA polymerase
MERTADDAHADEPDERQELFELARQLRGQLVRHAGLGAWAASGQATARRAGEYDEAAEAALREAPDVRDARDVREARDMREAPDARDVREAREARAAREAPDARDAREAKDTREAPDARAVREVRDARDAREARDVREAPEARAVREAWDAREAQDSRAAREAPDARGAMAVPAGMVREAVGPEAVDEGLVALGRRTLVEIRAELGDCQRCKLSQTRRSIVFGVGAAETALMFVGEAPGEQEDRRGEPFVGPAGQLLDKMIEAMGWSRASVYIANTTKCRPPNNRNPEPDELGACMPFLHAQIAAVAPRIIVALGRPAANQLLGTNAPISSLRGKFHPYARHGGPKIMPTFHPAYLLREPARKRDAWDDLKLVIAELTRLGISPPGAP